MDKFNLTKEEQIEFENNPIGSINYPLDVNQLILRKSIAQKIDLVYHSTDWFIQKEKAVKDTYINFPCWKF